MLICLKHPCFQAHPERQKKEEWDSYFVSLIFVAVNTLNASVKFTALDSLLCWNLQLHVRAKEHCSEFQPGNLLYSVSREENLTLFS